MNLSYGHSCAGKFKHASCGKAEAAIRSLYARYPEKQQDNYHAYHCMYCKHWHFGRQQISQWEKKKAALHSSHKQR